MAKGKAGAGRSIVAVVVACALALGMVPATAFAELVDEGADADAAQTAQAEEVAEAEADDEGASSEDAEADADATNDSAAVDSTDDEAATGDEAAADDDATTDADATAAEPTEREALDALAAANADVLPDGTYIVLNNKAGRGVLDVASGSTASKANVQLYHSNGTAAQQWTVTHDDAGYVTFTCVKSGMALDVSGGTAAKRTNVWQYRQNDTYAQKWIVVADDQGGYTLYSALAEGLALDIAGGSTTDKTNIQIYTANGTAAQSFTFVATDSATQAQSCSDTIASDAWFSLVPACASARALDIAGGRLTSGANAQLYTSTGALQQLFTFVYTSGYYRILCAQSGLALADKDGDIISGANVSQVAVSTSDATQLWSAQKNSDGTYTFYNKATGLALAVEGGASANGTNVCACTSDGSSAQRFALSKATNLLREGTYTIMASASTGYVFDVSGATVADGGNVQVWTSKSTNAQKYYISRVEGKTNTYTIEATNSGKCLTDENGNVVQRLADGGADQQWTVSLSTRGVTFKNVKTGKVIGVSDAVYAKGTNLKTVNGSGAWSQSFRLSRTSASFSAGTYYIYMASTTNKVVEVKDKATGNGANVQLGTKASRGGYQKWRITKNSDGTFTIVNCRSGKALDVTGSGTADGTNVQQYAKDNAKRQRWYITYEGGGWQITSALDSSVVLDISSGSTAAGTNIKVWHDKDTVGQRYVFGSTTYSASEEYTGAQLAMYNKAQSLSSSTGYLILVDTTNCKVGIFTGSKGNWSFKYYWSCSPGASSTPTVKGTFTTSSKGYSFGSSSYTCYYYTQFYGNYLFHSVLYYAGTFKVKDGRLGQRLSHGCVRLSLANAKWIYNNIPRSTKVKVY